MSTGKIVDGVHPFTMEVELEPQMEAADLWTVRIFDDERSEYAAGVDQETVVRAAIDLWYAGEQADLFADPLATGVRTGTESR